MKDAHTKRILLSDREFWLEELKFWYVYLKEHKGLLPPEIYATMKETMMICGEQSKEIKERLKKYE